ncbi:MAG: T9SS type A sorting domain-containing protein [Chitinophagales bacterium]
MKKIYYVLALALMLPFMATNAATGTIDLSGRTLTAIDGQVYDLGQLQADNTILIFDFWATWCGPCLSSIPGLDEIWVDHGPLGDQTYMIFSIETDQATTNEQEIIDAYGIPNPVIVGDNNTSVKSNEFAYTGSIPYFTVVCPDGSWEDRTGGIGTDPTPLLNIGNGCGVTSSIVNDARMLNVNVTQECPETNTWVPSLEIKNIGSTNLTSASVEVMVDGVVTETIEWTGDLASGGVETVDATAVVFNGVGTQTVEAQITSANGGVDDNTLNNVATGTKSYAISESLDIEIELILTSYPEETGYAIKDENGTVLSSASAGDYAGATSNAIINFTLPSFETCYTIDLTDSFGDGSGGIIVRNAAGDVLVENTSAYTTLSVNKLYASEDSDGDGFTDVVEDLSGSDKSDVNNTPENYNVGIVDVENVSLFNTYPNPAINELNVEVNTSLSGTISVELVDVLGRVVKTNTLTNDKTTFNTSALTQGIYLVNVKNNEGTLATSKVMIK